MNKFFEFSAFLVLFFSAAFLGYQFFEYSLPYAFFIFIFFGTLQSVLLYRALVSTEKWSR